MTYSDETSNRIDPSFLEVAHLDHLERYRFALPIAKGCKVLDVGCGFGYGSSILAGAAVSVDGVDLFREAIDYAKKFYEKGGCHFQLGNVCSLEFPAGHFDLVVCFEVIEHMDEPEKALAAIHRMLRIGGKAVISTPNRLVTAPSGGVSDPTHKREYTPDEFTSLLQDGAFADVTMFGQHIGEASGKIHKLRALLGRLDILGIRRLISSRMRANILHSTAKMVIAHAEDGDTGNRIDRDLNRAPVQIAVVTKVAESL